MTWISVKHLQAEERGWRNRSQWTLLISQDHGSGTHCQKHTQSTICHVVLPKRQMTPLTLLPSLSSSVLAKTKSMFCRVFFHLFPFSFSRVWAAAATFCHSVSCQKASPHPLTHDRSWYPPLTTVVRPPRRQHISLPLLTCCRHSTAGGGGNFGVVMTSSQPRLSLQRRRSHEGGERGSCREAEYLPSGYYRGH